MVRCRIQESRPWAARDSTVSSVTAIIMAPRPWRAAGPRRKALKEDSAGRSFRQADDRSRALPDPARAWLLAGGPTEGPFAAHWQAPASFARSRQFLSALPLAAAPGGRRQGMLRHGMPPGRRRE